MSAQGGDTVIPQHLPVYVYDDSGQFVPLVWTDTQNPVYLDDLAVRFEYMNMQIRVFAQKCAPPRKPKMFNSHQGQQVQRLRESGESYRKIARKFGCAESTVRNYLKNGM